MKIAVRGYGDNKLIFDEIVEIQDDDLDGIALRQIERVAQYRKHMIEIEFIDEPDNPNRFCRFGTDKRRMAQPIKIKF